MTWHYITLFLIAVLGGALGGLIVHIVWSLIQDWKLRKWIDKENKWLQEMQDIKWKQLTDEEIMSLIDKLHRDNKIDREMKTIKTGTETEKKIAIRGHKTRWNDVIKVLEDMGGENLAGWKGYDQMGAYYINDEGCIVMGSIEHSPVNESYSLYTLEEYEALQQNLKGLGTNKTEIGMKYKAGDRVKLVDSYPTACFKDWLGKVVTIDTAKDGFYKTLEIRSYFLTEDVIEGLVEEETKFGTASNPIEPKSNANCLTRERVDELATKIDEELPSGNQNVWELPDGYQFVDEEGNVINATKIALEKKKTEYPKTYEECVKFIKSVREASDRAALLCKLERLLVCRDAYWKIAGEEMGLGKPWRPDYDSGVDKFGIVYFDNTIMRTGALHRWERHLNKVLEFPTAEMRDAFYENFKELIEQCKELL